jgi:hypothetical protein
MKIFGQDREAPNLLCMHGQVMLTWIRSVYMLLCANQSRRTLTHWVELVGCLVPQDDEGVSSRRWARVANPADINVLGWLSAMLIISRWCIPYHQRIE